MPTVGPDRLTDVWPLFGLRLTVGDVELRLPGDADLVALADLAARGIHPTSAMPFVVPWTRARPPDLQRAFLQYHWGLRAGFGPDDWTLALAVARGGEPVGVQSISARAFAVRRAVETASWLARDHQRRGIGTAMRTAVLALAFDGIGARDAHSGAFEDNPASAVVSRRLGYADNGFRVHDREGRRAVERRFVLPVADWRAAPRPAVRISGLEECRDLLGAPAAN